MNLLFGFSGRIGRGRWWLAQFAVLILLVVTVAALVHVKGASTGHRLRAFPSDNPSANLVLLIGAALSLWVNFAATIKRYHDLDKSGRWSLLLFLPYIGGLWVLVECGFFSGSDGNNDYGPPPGAEESRSDLGAHISRMAAERSVRQQSLSARPEQRARAMDPANPAPQARRPTGPTGFGRRGL
ncbi:DUF805 domain-containing protein [Mesorhizobium erdmanii]|uniref:DUF805 domain-containing protein n=2 Tax=Mesorhizobium erdmanii TaxID=1777866 RepID=A0A6M7UMK9_9HYPH|nr:hypothetical protein A8146_21305 [Mesorhizobium loti]QKC78036.1 DUF805 domain-containing protein [Mesorhizobium erdmanii]